MDNLIDHEPVLAFWFEEAGSEKWFAKDEQFDERIKEGFGDLHTQAAAGELWGWRDSIRGRLAEIIVLDQFSRNMFRGQAQAFAYDRLALVLAQEAIKDKGIYQLTPAEKSFIFMPFMHSESKAIQAISVELFKEEGLESNLKFAIEHKEIVDRFGRYPHRNGVLGRESTPAELEFLKTHQGF